MRLNRDLSTSLCALFLLLFAALACSVGGEKSEQASSNGPSSNTANEKKAGDTSADSASKSGVHTEKIDLAKDDGSGGAGDTVTSFRSSDNPLHFVAHLSEFEAGTKVKMVLTAIDAGGTKNVKVGEVEKETSAFENIIDAHWKFPEDWPTGRYKIDAYINGKLDKTLEFDIS
jgi:hypothetical protein